MSRIDLALLILLALIGGIATFSYSTVRYRRYLRALARGRRRVKPIRRPFWMH